MNSSRHSITSKVFASLSHIESTSKQKWGIIAITFFSHMVLNNLLLSYGAILIMKAEDSEDLANLILAPSIFCVLSSFFDPIFREASENWTKNCTTRSLTACGILLTFLGISIGAFTSSPFLFSIIFGTMCGIGTRLALAQICFVMGEIFYTNIGVIQIIINLGESMGQAMLPHLMVASFEIFGREKGLLMIACLVLQILPVAFYVKSMMAPKNNKKYELTYSNIYAKFDSLDSIPQDIQLSDLCEKTWHNPSDQSTKSTDVEDKFVGEEKNLTFLGVEILPQIAEESEGDDEICNGDADKHPPMYNRISMISERVDDSTRTIVNPDVCPDPTQLKQHHFNNYALHPPERGKSGCSCWKSLKCTDYECYRTRRRIKNFVRFTFEAFVESMRISLKTWQFYPVLLIKLCTLLIPLGVSSLAPLMAKVVYPDSSAHLAVFLLSMHAFGWLLFLCLSPCLLNISKSKYKYFVIGGFFVSAVALFMVMRADNIIILNGLIFIIGMSHGSISITYMETLREFIGARKWSKIRDTLDRTSAVLLLALVLWMRHIVEIHHVKLCFGLFSTLQGVSGLVISMIPMVTTMVHRNAQNIWPQL